MRDPEPPPGKLATSTRDGREYWACYWCERFYCHTDPTAPRFNKSLPARKVWQCDKCGHFQVIGRGESVRAAALAADRNDTPAVDDPPHLPESIDKEKLAKIQREYDEMRRRHPAKGPSQTKISQLTAISRSTVREYWHFIRK